MSEPVVPCPTCPEGWRPLDKEHCADCYEGQIERLQKALSALQEIIEAIPPQRGDDLGAVRKRAKAVLDSIHAPADGDTLSFPNGDREGK